ncbi:MAG: diadenylate cyclase [Salinarchaeum sp.]
MTPDDPLHAEYDTVPNLIDVIFYVSESISVDFDRWEEQYVTGPGLYFVVISSASYEGFADPLGANTWPVDDCRIVPEAPDGFFEAAHEVSLNRDGAVVVAADGTIQEQMVRIKGLSGGQIADHDIEYADWMGTKHLSAVEVSVRDEVLAAVTISEENGRVTVFKDGSYQDYARDELGGRWRIDPDATT